MLDYSGKQDARQERFARASRAENARRALDEFFQVDADGVPLLAGVADDEIAFENFVNIACLGKAHRRGMTGHRFDRHSLLRKFAAAGVVGFQRGLHEDREHFGFGVKQFGARQFCQCPF